MEKTQQEEEIIELIGCVSETNTEKLLKDISKKIGSLETRLIDVMQGILEELIKLNNNK